MGPNSHGARDAKVQDVVAMRRGVGERDGVWVGKELLGMVDSVVLSRAAVMGGTPGDLSSSGFFSFSSFFHLFFFGSKLMGFVWGGIVYEGGDLMDAYRLEGI